MMRSRQDRRRSRGANRDTVPGSSPARDGRSTGDTTLRIDRIVVEGLGQNDVETFAGALDRELRSRLRERQMESGGPRRVERVDAGVIDVQGHDRAVAIAERLAACIVERSDS